MRYTARLMTLYDRYLTRRYLSTIAKILIAFVLLFIVVDFIVQRSEQLAKYDVPTDITVRYYIAFIPTVIFQYHTLGLAVLVAALMTLGKASQDQEITAALAGGVSLMRLARFPIIATLLLALGAFFVEDTLGVQANQTARQIEREYFTRYSSSDNDVVSWPNLEDGWICYILQFNHRALTGQDVFLQNTTGGTIRDIRANRIFWDPDQAQWILEDGTEGVYALASTGSRKLRRITQEAAPFKETPETLFALRESPDTKSAATLASDLRRAEASGTPTGSQWIDYHIKYARPAICFIMIGLGLPFAMRIQRGGILAGLGISIIIGLCYILTYYFSVAIGRIQLIPPLYAAWFANALFACIALILLRRTPT